MRSALLALVVLASLLAPHSPARAADDAAYRTPPAAVADLLTAPRVPRGAPNTSGDGAWLAVPDLRSLIPIATLAEPVEKLAGLEILPGLHATRNGLKNAAAGLTFYRVADGVKVRAKLPADARLGAVVWSNAGDRVACALFAEGGAQLWIVEAATGTAMHIEKVALQGVPSLWMEWTLDDKALLCALVRPDRPLAAIVLVALYASVHLGLRAVGVARGYTQGPSVLAGRLRGGLQSAITVLAWAGCIVLGVLVAWSLAPLGEPRPLAVQSALAGGLGLGLLSARRARPSPTQWALGLGVLVVLVAWMRPS